MRSNRKKSLHTIGFVLCCEFIRIYLVEFRHFHARKKYVRRILDPRNFRNGNNLYLKKFRTIQTTGVRDRGLSRKP